MPMVARLRQPQAMRTTAHVARLCARPVAVRLVRRLRPHRSTTRRTISIPSAAYRAHLKTAWCAMATLHIPLLSSFRLPAIARCLFPHYPPPPPLIAPNRSQELPRVSCAPATVTSVVRLRRTARSLTGTTTRTASRLRAPRQRRALRRPRRPSRRIARASRPPTVWAASRCLSGWRSASRRTRPPTRVRPLRPEAASPVATCASSVSTCCTRTSTTCCSLRTRSSRTRHSTSELCHFSYQNLQILLALMVVSRKP